MFVFWIILKYGACFLAVDEEKKYRGSLLSSIERSLNTNTIVIADGMNYIKGFRYQIYLISRALGTSQCLVTSDVRWSDHPGSLCDILCESS